MNDQTLDRQLAFLTEIDKLKSIVRASLLIDKSRRENSAEHSWHVAMYALVLAEHASDPVDISRVIRMLLIHDIVEIDAGDVPIYAEVDTERLEQIEARAAERLFGLLPGAQGEEMLALWTEFEAGQSNDARFAKSLDRFHPLINNIETDGGTWAEFNVTGDQVIKRIGPPIERGSTRLWRRAKSLIDGFFHLRNPERPD